jgi:hypothetical protein
MMTPSIFGEGLRKTILAFALVLVPFAAFGTSALAGDLPKQGTYSTTWTFSGPYTVIELGEDKYSWMSEFTFVVWNNSGAGVLHDMSGHCDGLGVGDAGNGYCALVDADGDKIYWAFTDVGGGKGSATLEGGTGKYSGIQGNEEYEFVYTPDAPEGTFHGHGGSKGSYTLP